MKILMFGWEFPPFISGGLGTACYGLTKSMAGRGMDISFVLPRVKGNGGGSPVRILDASQIDLGVTGLEHYEHLGQVITVDSLLSPYHNAVSYEQRLRRTREMASRGIGGGSTVLDFSGDYGDTLMQEVDRLKAVGAALGRRENWDLIHAHDWMTFPAGLAAKAASGRPLVVHVHATEFDRSGENVNNEIYNIERAGMHGADAVIAVSNLTREIIIRRYEVPPEKVHVVHNAVIKDDVRQVQEITRGLNEKIVLFLGRITMQKGPGFFVDAAARVLKKLKNIRFVMAGSGDLMSRIIHRIAELRIQDRFHFTGFLRGADLEQMFLMTDLLVMPSVSEPFGIVPIEAMRYGVPVIVSKQSGVAEVLEHAVKVDFWDTHLLGDEIVRILSNDKVAQTMAGKNAESLDRIHWDNSADNVIAVYRRLGQ